MDFCLFSTSHRKLIFQGKCHGKVMEFCTNHQFHARYVARQPSSLHFKIHHILSRSLVHVHVYYNVCVVMVVAVRGGHLYFSKN